MANSFFEQGKEAGKAWRLEHLDVEGGGVQMDAARTASQMLRLAHDDDDMEFYSGWYASIDEVDAKAEKARHRS